MLEGVRKDCGVLPKNVACSCTRLAETARSAHGEQSGRLADQRVVLLDLLGHEAEFAVKLDCLLRTDAEAVEAADAGLVGYIFWQGQAERTVGRAFSAAVAFVHSHAQALAVHFLIQKDILAQVSQEEELADQFRAASPIEEPGVADGEKVFLPFGVMDERGERPGLGRGKRPFINRQRKCLCLPPQFFADQAPPPGGLQRADGVDVAGGEAGRKQVEKIGISANENCVCPHWRAFGRPQTFHCHQPVNNVQMRAAVFRDADNIVCQGQMGLFLVFLANQAADQIFQTDRHACFKMGFQLGHVDEEIRLCAFLGNASLHAVSKRNGHRLGIVEVNALDSIVPGQRIDPQPGDHADAAAVKAAVGALANGDVLIASCLLEKEQHSGDEAQVCGVAGQGVHVAVQIRLEQNAGPGVGRQQVAVSFQPGGYFFPQFVERAALQNICSIFFLNHDDLNRISGPECGS